MNPWLESLSEDWVSQPRSSSPSLPHGSPQSPSHQSVQIRSQFAVKSHHQKALLTRGNVDLFTPMALESVFTSPPPHRSTESVIASNEEMSSIHITSDGHVIGFDKMSTKYEREVSGQSEDSDSPYAGLGLSKSESELNDSRQYELNHSVNGLSEANDSRAGRSEVNESSSFRPDESLNVQTPEGFAPVSSLPRLPFSRKEAIATAAASPEDPRTPERSGNQAQLKSSGSPLKLFTEHDTFTNQKLIRRLTEHDIETEHQNETGNVQETRKRSVTTQDYLDEAMKIMDFIRAKRDAVRGLASVQEHVADDSSVEEFERPPSREGRRSLRELRAPRPMDPQILIHLDKYREDDNEDFMSSFRQQSLSLGHRPPLQATTSADNITLKRKHSPEEFTMKRKQSPGDITLKRKQSPRVPTVNATGSPALPTTEHKSAPEIQKKPSEGVTLKRKQSPRVPTVSATGSPAIPTKEHKDEPEIQKKPSEGATLKRKHSPSSSQENTVVNPSLQRPSTPVQTGSSTRSDRLVLSPDKVGHLIGNQVGSMRYDCNNQKWIKKSPQIQETSDEDPLGNIPDLRELSVPPNSVPPKSSTKKSYVSFHLSPLPDFTLHDLGESCQQDVSYVAKKEHKSSKANTQYKFSLSTQELVKKIADVEPYEPYWDHIRNIDLSGKKLVTLHKLEDFCSRIETLDVSNNQLGQLSGAPFTLRHLKVPRNCLSNMTAWGHLGNLQSIDLSGNQLESLDGLKSLVHLRELVVNDNKIKSLRGVFELDGLISLKAQRNCVRTLDFTRAQLSRLQELDVSENEVSSVKALKQLPALAKLDLHDNQVKEFPANAGQNLELLNLSGNQLKELDVTTFRKLQTLQLDDNQLYDVKGIKKLKYIQTLSLRQQGTPKNEKFKPLALDSFSEIKNLYLSNNLLPLLYFKNDFPNLHYLEITGCGLARLPVDFGRRMPNLRSLNLNSNAIKDIKPLSTILRLETLHLAGNRISRLRRTAKVLKTIGKSLTDVDLRDNPFTLGFYPSPPMAHIPTTAVARTPPKSAGAPNSGESQPHEEAFTLPLAAPDKDAAYRARLDEDTQIRRRVYEIIIGLACRQLTTLDGLPISIPKTLSKDPAFSRLVELGVVKERE